MSLAEDVAGCMGCARRGPGVTPMACAPKPAPVAFIFESPGRGADEMGIFAAGPAYDLLRTLAGRANIDMAEAYCTGVVRCAGERPEDPEVSACAGHLDRELDLVRPKVIVALGRWAALHFARAESDRGASLRRGRLLEYKGLGGWTAQVILTLNPSTVIDMTAAGRLDAEDALVADLCVVRGLFVERERGRCETGQRVARTYAAGRAFVHGWHTGSKLFLISRENGVRTVEQVDETEARYYFLVHQDDLTASNRAKFDAVLRQGFACGKQTVMVRGVAPDPQLPRWLRVYPDVPDLWVSRGCRSGLDEWDARRFQSRSPYIASLVRAFRILGITSYEADVDPLQRFMADRVLTLAAPRRCFIDLETDDTDVEGDRAVLGRTPILAWALCDAEGRRVARVMESWCEDAERDLLLELAENLSAYDEVCAWYGRGFDFPYLFERWRRLGIDGKPFAFGWHDQMESFERHYERAADGRGRLGLDAVAREVLGRGKVGLPAGGMRTLWRESRTLLETYNRNDCELLVDLEARCGTVQIETEMSLAAGCFAADDLVSERVDAMALAHGYRRGTHFPTRETTRGEAEAFEGGMVLEPVRGLHRGVTVFDFASLYPSMMTEFNISPETYLVDRDAQCRPPASMTLVPTSKREDGTAAGGQRFLRQPKGLMPTIYGVASAGRGAARAAAEALEARKEDARPQRLKERAWKVLGLSIYGAMGNPHARYFDRRVAEAVTAAGRFHLLAAAELAARRGKPALYGDTDSLFMPFADAASVDEFRCEFGKLMTAVATRCNAVENCAVLRPETTYRALLLVEKKCYAGWTTADELKVRGLEARRGEVCTVARAWQLELLELLLRDGADEAALRERLEEYRRFMLQGGPTLADVAETMGLSSAIEKYRNRPPHVRAAEMLREAGRPVWPGMKVTYVVVDGDADPPKVAPVEMTERYDARFYWNRKVLPPLIRVLEAAHPGRGWADFAEKKTSGSGTIDLF